MRLDDLFHGTKRRLGFGPWSRHYFERRFAVRDPAGLEIYRWTALPERPVLAPGQQMAFRSRLAAPPAESSEVMVRFLGGNDAVAGLQ